jgi:ribosome biogenesis protein BMS1
MSSLPLLALSIKDTHICGHYNDPKIYLFIYFLLINLLIYLLIYLIYFTLLIIRTTAQIRKDEQVALVINKDSVYKPIERVERVFAKQRIPLKLQESLPFASKLKQDKPLNPKSYLARRAVVIESSDRKERAMLQQLSTIRKDKETKREQAKTKSRQEKLAAKARESAKFSDVHKEEKKRKFKEQGLEQQKRLKAI